MRGAGSPIVSMHAPDKRLGVSLGLLLLGNVLTLSRINAGDSQATHVPTDHGDA
jgi:hypothetical protein